jgi:hypothetical protein
MCRSLIPWEYSDDQDQQSLICCDGSCGLHQANGRVCPVEPTAADRAACDKDAFKLCTSAMPNKDAVMQACVGRKLSSVRAAAPSSRSAAAVVGLPGWPGIAAYEPAGIDGGRALEIRIQGDRVIQDRQPRAPETVFSSRLRRPLPRRRRAAGRQSRRSWRSDLAGR